MEDYKDYHQHHHDNQEGKVLTITINPDKAEGLKDIISQYLDQPSTESFCLTLCTQPSNPEKSGTGLKNQGWKKLTLIMGLLTTGIKCL